MTDEASPDAARVVEDADSLSRRHVEQHRPRFEASRPKREALADRFFDAIGHGDMQGLVELLADDVSVVGDSGGTRPSWPRPILGRDRVARLLFGLGTHARDLAATLRRGEVNGQPGVLVIAPSGRLIYVMTVDIADGRVQTVRSIINPERLSHLGPLADVRALLHERSVQRGA